MPSRVKSGTPPLPPPVSPAGIASGHRVPGERLLGVPLRPYVGRRDPACNQARQFQHKTRDDGQGEVFVLIR